MSSPSLSASPSALTREFLVQRLVTDAQARSRTIPQEKRSVGSNSDSEEPHSDSSSDPGTTEERSADISATFPAFRAAAAMAQQGAGAQTFVQNQLHYAATLASLAHMNFLQPTANTLPLLYPHLYQSLLTFPNLEQVRRVLQSPGKRLASPGSEKTKTTAGNATPDTAKTTLSAFSPSPRKRPSSQKGAAKSESKISELSSPSKKPRAIKRLQFDEETSSPVSGMFIKDAVDLPPAAQLQAEADLGVLDDSARFVEVTDEVRAELAKIPNVIGDFVCRLCKVRYEDAFKLAQHKCPRIVHEEYRCPECDKVFSCPANLASHRRWHKPRDSPTGKNRFSSHRSESQNRFPEGSISPQPLNLSKPASSQDSMAREIFACELCERKFENLSLLRNHAITHTFAPDDYAQDGEIKCAECDLWFPEKVTAEKHRKTAHPKFFCKFCPENFATSPALTRHINKRHPTSVCRVVLLNEESVE